MPDELELLDTADQLSRVASGIPGPRREGEALGSLMAQVDEARMNPATTGLGAVLSAFASGPVWRTALAAGAALFVLSGVGLGAAAATGNDPARTLLGISTSAISVEFTGVVVEVQPGALRIDANGDLRIVTADANTEITSSGEGVPFEAIAPAMTVEVHGRLLTDNTIYATRVNIEDSEGNGSPTEAGPTAQATAAGPTVDDDHDDGDDDDGLGDEADDHGEDADGPGHGNDDGDNGDEDHSSGPGDGDDDRHEGDDDFSGPGAGDNGGEGDDSSGPGTGNDHRDDGGGDDDDRSGSNSGSDGGDEDEDDGGSGSGGDDD